MVFSVSSRESAPESSTIVDCSKALIISDEHDLWALDLSSNIKKLLRQTAKGITTFAIFGNSTIYYHETNSSWLSSLSRKHANLTEARQWDPTATAVDPVTEKLYVLDSLAGKLSVFDINNGNYGIALADLRDPVDLALDPSRGLMFIVQKFNSVSDCRRLNLSQLFEMTVNFRC